MKGCAECVSFFGGGRLRRLLAVKERNESEREQQIKESERVIKQLRNELVEVEKREGDLREKLMNVEGDKNREVKKITFITIYSKSLDFGLNGFDRNINRVMYDLNLVMWSHGFRGL